VQALFDDERTQKNAKSQTKYSNGNRRGRKKQGERKKMELKCFYV